jgi:hypothetical protein
MYLRAVEHQYMKVIKVACKGTSDKLCEYDEMLDSLTAGNLLTNQAKRAVQKEPTLCNE